MQGREWGMRERVVSVLIVLTAYCVCVCSHECVYTCCAICVCVWEPDWVLDAANKSPFFPLLIFCHFGQHFGLFLKVKINSVNLKIQSRNIFCGCDNKCKSSEVWWDQYVCMNVFMCVCGSGGRGRMGLSVCVYGFLLFFGTESTFLRKPFM